LPLSPAVILPLGPGPETKFLDLAPAGGAKKVFFEILGCFNKTTYLCGKNIHISDMSKYEIPFLTACIQAFGHRFSMTRQAAFRYLHEHKGLEFLIEFYDVEHLQSMDETIDDLLIICQKNGGTLA